MKLLQLKLLGNSVLLEARTKSTIMLGNERFMHLPELQTITAYNSDLQDQFVYANGGYIRQ